MRLVFLHSRQRQGIAQASEANKPPAERASKLDPFRAQIKEKVLDQNLTTVRILRELQESGYTGGRTILADYVRALRTPLAPRARKVTRRFETEPGEETQIDWSTYRIELGGRERTTAQIDGAEHPSRLTARGQPRVTPSTSWR